MNWNQHNLVRFFEIKQYVCSFAESDKMGMEPLLVKTNKINFFGFLTKFRINTVKWKFEKFKKCT